MKELDLILEGWIERHYPTASREERAQFAKFLELPDPEIADYLLGAGAPRDTSMAALIAQLVEVRCPTSN